MAKPKRSPIERLFRYFALAGAAAILYVLLDFMIDLRPQRVYSTYLFDLPELVPDAPVILRQDNLAIVVVRRSPGVVDALRQAGDGLQDPASRRSHQPDYAANAVRSREPGYFVAYALGTDLGCALEVEAGGLRETCSDARYDLAGRARAGARDFRNLTVPDYNFGPDYKTLIIRP